MALYGLYTSKGIYISAENNTDPILTTTAIKNRNVYDQTDLSDYHAQNLPILSRKEFGLHVWNISFCFHFELCVDNHAPLGEFYLGTSYFREYFLFESWVNWRITFSAVNVLFWIILHPVGDIALTEEKVCVLYMNPWIYPLLIVVDWVGLSTKWPLHWGDNAPPSCLSDPHESVITQWEWLFMTDCLSDLFHVLPDCIYFSCPLICWCHGSAPVIHMHVKVN